MNKITHHIKATLYYSYHTVKTKELSAPTRGELHTKMKELSEGEKELEAVDFSGYHTETVRMKPTSKMNGRRTLVKTPVNFKLKQELETE